MRIALASPGIAASIADGLDRVRALGGPPAPQGRAFAERDFVFVGRFVAKKNIVFLVEAFARYFYISRARG